MESLSATTAVTWWAATWIEGGRTHLAFSTLPSTSQRNSSRPTTEKTKSYSFVTCMATVGNATFSCTVAYLGKRRSTSTRITTWSKCCHTFSPRRIVCFHLMIASSRMKRTRRQRLALSCLNSMEFSTHTLLNRPFTPRSIRRTSIYKVRSASPSRMTSRWRAQSWYRLAMISARLWSRWLTARFWNANSRWTPH